MYKGDFNFTNMCVIGEQYKIIGIAQAETIRHNTPLLQNNIGKIMIFSVFIEIWQQPK